MRVYVVRNGKVLRGRRKLFYALVKKEARVIKGIWKKIRAEHPRLYKDIPDPPDWEVEAIHSLITASFRLGCGDISVNVRSKKS